MKDTSFRLFVVLSLITSFLLAAGESSAEIGAALLSDLGSKDDGIRASAVERLGSIRDEEAFAVLMKIVAHAEENWKVRIKAIRLLGEIGDPRSTDLLLYVFGNPFMNEECPAIKWTTTIALGHFRNDSRVVDTLIDALNYRNLLVREAAIQSLGNIGASKAVDVLIKALNDKSFAIRISAITALGKIGSPKAVPHLKKVWEASDDPFIKGEAISALNALKQS